MGERVISGVDPLVLLPPSALAKLASLHIEYPMLFQLSNKKQKVNTHAGVLEFIAEEGKVFLPRWVLNFIYMQDDVDFTSAGRRGHYSEKCIVA